jgi:hypothetical protein
VIAPLSPMREKIVRLMSRSYGVATDEVDGYSMRQVARAIQALLESGKAFKARHTGKEVRYFSTAYDAETWLKKRADEDAAADQAAKAKASPDDAVAQWPADAPKHFPTDKNGVPTWKFTACPPSPIGTRRTGTHSEEY